MRRRAVTPRRFLLGQEFEPRRLACLRKSFLPGGELMKKIIKIKVPVVRDKEGTHYKYPKAYDAKKILVLGYGEGGPDFDHLVGVIDEKDLAQFLGGMKASEITPEDANVFVRATRVPRVRIVDDQKFLRVLKEKIPGLLGVEEDKPFDVADYL